MTVLADAPARQDERSPVPPADATRHRWWALLRSPLFLLGVLLVVSTGTRAAWISVPDEVASDERFYVSAARHIASLPLPRSDNYSNSPPGIDPNAEHPPLAKLLIATSMRVFGDKPLGWRLPSILFGTLAVAALYFLGRSAGAGPYESLGAAALMAADNMFVVYGRFATLDVFVLVFMLVGVGLYLRGRPVLAGLVLGVGACTKTIGLSALAVIAVVELLRRVQRHRPGDQAQDAASHDLARLGACVLASAVAYLGVLGVLDRTVSEFPDPVSHTRYMVTYAGITTFQAEAQVRGTFTAGALAPVSRPWQWLANDGTFFVHRQAAAPPGQPGADRILVRFEARTSPAVIFLVGPILLFLAYRAWAYADGPSNLALAWCTATFALFIAVILRERVSYIYYVLTFLPGVYLGIARLLSRHVVPRLAIVGYAILVLASLAAMYPFRTWGGL